MRIKVVVGKLLYGLVKWFPASYSVGGKLARYLRYYSGRMVIERCGKNVNIERGAYFTRLLEIGDNSGIGIKCNISGKVIIGNNVMMAPNVSIITVNHKYMNKYELIGKQGNAEEQPVIIGNDVWIGMNAIILPGVHIADGCVVGAGAVVSKSTEPYSIVAGNPARTVKYRT